MISTHILDLNTGLPAKGVTVTLEKKDQQEHWQSISECQTDNDGRISFQCDAKPGVYQLQFFVEEYFKAKSIEPFFLTAPVIFKITDTNRKYHVPLLLSSYGYSTYRGS